MYVEHTWHRRQGGVNVYDLKKQEHRGFRMTSTRSTGKGAVRPRKGGNKVRRHNSPGGRGDWIVNPVGQRGPGHKQEIKSKETKGSRKKNYHRTDATGEGKKQGEENDHSGNSSHEIETAVDYQPRPPRKGKIAKGSLVKWQPVLK